MASGIVALVAAISADVVAALAAASLPPLTPQIDGSAGAILLGQEHLAEQSAPPRVVFVPTKSVFAPKDQFARAVVMTDAERAAMRNQRVLRLENVTFEVHVWGQAGSSSTPVNEPADNYDATQVLYQQVIRSIHLLCPGCYELGAGTWNRDPKVVVAGREFVFEVTIYTPLIDKALEPAPANVAGEITVQDANVTPPETAAVVTT